MTEIYVDQLEVGMKLARPVSRREHVIFPAGTLLTPRHIHLMYQYNINQVYVENISRFEVA